MGMPGIPELLIIMVILLIVFGGGKIAGVGKSLGTAIREFKTSVTGPTDEESDSPEEKSSTTTNNETHEEQPHQQ